MNCPNCETNFSYGFSLFSKTILGRINCPKCDSKLTISPLKYEVGFLLIAVLSFVLAIVHPVFSNPIFGALTFVLVLLVISPVAFLIYREQKPKLATSFLSKRQQNFVLMIKNNAILNFVNRNVVQVFLLFLSSHFFVDMSGMIFNLPCGGDRNSVIEYILPSFLSTLFLGCIWLVLNLLNLARLVYITKNPTLIVAGKIDTLFWMVLVSIALSGLMVFAYIYGVRY